VASPLDAWDPAKNKKIKVTGLFDNTQVKLDRIVASELAQLSPAQYENFNKWVSRYPNQSKDLIMSAVRMNIPVDAPGVEKLTSVDGVAQLKQDLINTENIKSKIKEDKGFLRDLLDVAYGQLKGTSRLTFATLRAPYEYVSNVGRNLYALANDKKKPGFNELIQDLSPAAMLGEETQLGQLAREVLFNPTKVDTGSGFFIGAESKVQKAQAKAMATYGLVNGQSFTLGRAAMKTVGSDPNSTQYKVMSGIIDATLNVALDPSIWFGPGAITKVAGTAGKRKTAILAAQNELEAQTTKLKEAANLTKEEKKLLKERTAGAKELTRAAENTYMKAEKTLQDAQLARVNADYKVAAKRFAADRRNKANIAGPEGLPLENNEVGQFIFDSINAGKQRDTVDLLGKLSADFFNTGKAFPAALHFDELPGAGALGYAARGNDEFVVKLTGDRVANIVDLSADFATANKKAIIAEIERRTEIIAFIRESALNTELPKSTRSVFKALADNPEELLKTVNGLLGTGTPEGLGVLIGRIAAAKNADATALLTDKIESVWKADGFANIRSIHGGTGGIAITNYDLLAARKVRVSEVLAEASTNPGAAILKVDTAIENADRVLIESQKALDDATRGLDEINARISDIGKLQEFVQKDPDLLRMILNDPDNIGIAKLLDLDEKILDTRYAKELLLSQVGLTDGFGGGLSKDTTTAMKFLFGKKFLAVAEIVAKETNTMRIDRLFGRKLDIEIADELAQANTVEGVISVMLRHLASPEADPQLARTMLMRAELALNSKNPLIKLSDPINLKAVSFVERAEKALSNIYIRSTLLPLNDLDRLTRGLNDWFTTALGKDKVTQDAIDDILNKVIQEKDYTARSKIIMDGMKFMNEQLVQRHGAGSPELAKLLDDSLKLSGKDQALIQQYNVAKLATGSNPTMILNNGEIMPMTGANYAHQFLDDVIRLPDTRPIIDALNKYSTNVPLYGKANALKTAANELGDYWRTAQLVGRVSYILRNVGEMQMRQFFSGHDSIFNHPIGYIAMAMANPKGTAMQKLAARIGKYQNDIFGTNFKDDAMTAEFTQAVEEYMQFMQRSISAGDPRTAFVGKIYEVIDSTHESYYKGLATTLIRFASDDLIPLVARANTPELQDDLVRYLTENKKGIEILKKIHNGARISRDVSGKKVSDFDKILLKDPDAPFSKDNLNVDNIRGYLFDTNSTASLEYAIQSIGGKGPKAEYIRDILANGKTVVTQGNKTFEITIPRYSKLKAAEEMSDLETAFKSQLSSFFRREDMPEATALLSSTKRFADGEPKILSKGVDWFFQLSSKFENLANFGPEYRMAYWDHVGRYANMLDTKDLQKLYKSAMNTLAPIKIGGKRPIGRKHQTIRVIEQELKRRKKGYTHKGGMTLEQLNSMASKVGAKYTRDLFYDASRQLQSAQAMRLVFPFVQAQLNTMRVWGKLFKANPVNFYKLGRAYNALTKEGTSAIYDITGVKYDEGQGFIYEDEFGEKRFRYPLAGSFMGALVGKNLDSSEALQLTAPVQSLNLAFGNVNPGVPGIGPAGQFAYMASGKSAAFGPVWDTVRTFVLPFGQPEGYAEVIVPSWLNKTFLYFINDQKIVERGVKDWASFLASTGEYGDNPLADDVARNQLFKDAEGMSRGIGLLTAIFQSIAPATPSQEVFAKIPNNKKIDFASMTMLYNAWDQISRKHPGDYFAAVNEFSNEFGERNLLAIIGGSTRNVTGTKDAWTFLNMHPEAAEKYATKNGDIVPFFFPGGEGATAYYAWQRFTGRREALSTEEISAAAEELVYKMAKSQISEMQATMGYSDFWYAQQVDQLNKRFGGSAPASIVNVGTDQERIANVADALQDPAFQMSPVFKETQQFYARYSEAIELLKKARVTPEPDLGSSHWYATMMRKELEELADKLMIENPAFAPMYYRVFAGTMKTKD